MASCSSSAAISSQSPKKYDVFISFRGEDTRNNFTSHLHDALCRNKIETYIDYILEKGDEVWSSLEKAIEDSIVFLVIFSTNYASSTWCLKEVTKILECVKDQSQLVIPVFYKIDPSHVRKQRGSYQLAFAEYEQSNHKHLLHKWRTALTKAANLTGWHYNSERNEAEFIKEIVECVKSKLGYMYQSESDSKGFVGIHKKVVDIELLLYNGSQDVQFIGIWGLGGIGKTTLARAVFNKLCFAYEGSCFLAKVREESKKHGITRLKNEVILTLLEDKESHPSMLDREISYVMRRLSRKKVFLVLDDVDDPEQLEKLVGHHWFGSGSKVIITTRDKHVLGMEVDYTYEIEALDFGEAFYLFSLKAFKKDCFDLKFKKLAEDMVKYAGGIPLALKVLGSLLYGKNKEEWESEWKKLKKMPHPKIQNVLRLSFDGLDYEEKEIFLHIACFFKNKQLEDIKSLLDACGYSTTIGLKNLEDKALLTIPSNKVSMHDLLEEMGKEIVREESRREPEKRSRLWDPNDVYQVLNNNKGTEAIEGITLDTSKIPNLHLNPQIFSRMKKLKFLEFYKCSDGPNILHSHQEIEYLPNELRLLRWHEYPSKCFPATFSAEKLVKIKMPNSQLRTLWNGIQNVANLKKINLRDSIHLIELPNFSKALHLKEVDLDNCTMLREVHPSILSLRSLEKLSLARCESLTCIKSNTHLRSLQYLSLSGCSRLRECSVTSENVSVELDLSYTAIVNNGLFSSSGCLGNINTLRLFGCTNLSCLPDKLLDLKYLNKLVIHGCDKLALNLRFVFDHSRFLTKLFLDSCVLFELPDNISLLSSLDTLSLSGTNVDSLPVSIKHLTRLHSIHVDECKRLRSLPELPPSIELLSARHCASLETLRLTSTSVAISAIEDDDVFLYFKNCAKLEKQSIKAILGKAMVESRRFARAQVVYPGCKVPEWFMYKTTQSSINMNLSSIPHSNDWHCIFSAVVSHCPSSPTFIGVTWGFANCPMVCYNGYNYHCYVEPDIASDHVYVWYASKLPLGVQRMIEESRANDKSTAELKIELKYDEQMEITKFGVCPAYSLEYQAFIKQMELELQPSPIGMEVGFSYDNTYLKETLPQKRKYDCLIEEIE